MTDNSRLGMVLDIVRRYSSEHERTIRYEVDELVSELYIELDKWINDDPFIDSDRIMKLGLAHCTRFVNKITNNRVVKYRDNGFRMPKTSSPGSTHNLLALWCSSRKLREGKKPQSRLIAYLHYVEQLPVEEIAEIFDKPIQAIHSTIYGMQLARRKLMYKRDDVVMLVMDNPFFHRMLAWVKEATEYGAIVEVESHHYPERKRWQLRALHSEMVYIGSLVDKQIEPIKPDEAVDGNKHVVSNALAIGRYEVSYRVPPIPNGVYHPVTDPQFTGDECNSCGKMMMVRAGTCLTCTACGMSSGC